MRARIFRSVRACLLLAFCAAPDLWAEPYLAVRTGLKCSQCHVNRSGGGGRNDFGSAWAQTTLPRRTVGVRSRSLNDWVAIGLDLRTVVSGTVSRSTPRTSIGVEEAQVQIQARLIPNRLSLYVDQGLGAGGEGAAAREAFGLVEGLPLNGYAKAGRFMLPFGWRLWDDAAFIRELTGFTYRTPDQGLEIGIEPGAWSLFVALSNGNAGAAENDSEKQITSSVAYVQQRFRVGASAARNSGPGSRRAIVGGFGGFSVGPIVVLGEADWIFDAFESGPDRDQFVAYVEGDVLATKGLNAKVTYGYHDRDLNTPEDQRIRMRFGLEAFPVSFVQLAAFYTVLDDVPQVTTDRDQVSLELHVHF
jgi:hypothetical protein